MYTGLTVHIVLHILSDRLFLKMLTLLCLQEAEPTEGEERRQHFQGRGRGGQGQSLRHGRRPQVSRRGTGRRHRQPKKQEVKIEKRKFDKSCIHFHSSVCLVT